MKALINKQAMKYVYFYVKKWNTMWIMSGNKMKYDLKYLKQNVK